MRTLQFFNADPNDFDLIFVSNATAAIKLVAESFRDYQESSGNSKRSKEFWSSENGKRSKGFWYGYHRDSHTSLNGVREFANGGHHCFTNDEEVNDLIHGSEIANSAKIGPRKGQVALFAFPGQSNMTGRRLPLTWYGLLLYQKYSKHEC